MASGVRVYIAQNFLECGSEVLPDASYLERADVFYDIRTNMLVNNVDMLGMQWYYNYLESNARFAFKNPNAYPGYLLNLGYIPVVFLPSCCAQDRKESSRPSPSRYKTDPPIPHPETTS